jgi:ribosomal-protein-alanine N-acetyltransferase
MGFLPIPTLNTERLVLRPLLDEDDQAIFILRTSDSINKFIDRPKPANLEEVKQFISKINDGIEINKWYYWAICFKDQVELIGTICVWNFSEDRSAAEVGYELLPSLQKRGIMDEALKSVLDFVFKLPGFKALEANTHADNDASSRLLTRNNFVADKTRIDKLNLKNRIFVLNR